MPSSIAEILLEQGRQAADLRARNGAIWGNAVGNISNLPAEVIGQHRQAVEDDRRAQAQADEAKLRAVQLQGATQQQQDVTLTDKILSDPAAFNPDGTPNTEGLLAKAREFGAGHLVPKLSELADTLTASHQQSVERQQKIEQGYAETRAKVAEQLDGMDNDLGSFHTAVASLAAQGAIPKDQANAYLGVQDSKLAKQITDSWKPKKPLMPIGPNGLFDPNTNAPVPGTTGLKAPPEPTEAVLDAAAQKLYAKRIAGQEPLTTDEQAQLQAYEQRKRVINPDAQAQRTEAAQGRAQAHADALDAKDTTNRTQSYQFHIGQLEKVAAPIAGKEQEFANLRTLLDQHTPQADADVAPKLLTAFAGGPGSGLRMNQATIDRNAGGHTAWVGLQQALNRFSSDPTHASIPEAQRQQIYSLIGAAESQIGAKQSEVDKFRQTLADPASTVDQHRKGWSDLQRNLSKIEASVGKSGGDIKSAAAAVLQQNGKASDDAAVATFLKNNPNWKP